jgi:hypothetical protein
VLGDFDLLAIREPRFHLFSKHRSGGKTPY